MLRSDDFFTPGKAGGILLWPTACIWVGVAVLTVVFLAAFVVCFVVSRIGAFAILSLTFMIFHLVGFLFLSLASTIVRRRKSHSGMIGYD